MFDPSRGPTLNDLEDLHMTMPTNYHHDFAYQQSVANVAAEHSTISGDMNSMVPDMHSSLRGSGSPSLALRLRRRARLKSEIFRSESGSGSTKNTLKGLMSRWRMLFLWMYSSPEINDRKF